MNNAKVVPYKYNLIQELNKTSFFNNYLRMDDK